MTGSAASSATEEASTLQRVDDRVAVSGRSERSGRAEILVAGAAARVAIVGAAFSAGDKLGDTGRLLVWSMLFATWYLPVFVASLAAREILVATLAQIYAAEQTDEDDGGSSLREALRSDRRADGSLVFDPPTVGALLVFFVFALQCTSTIAIIKRETNSWRWPAFAFTYLFVLAYVASFATHRIVGALV